MTTAYEIRTIETGTCGCYLLDAPPHSCSEALFGFHGYGENAVVQLERLQYVSAGQFLCCSIQALHPFYTKRNSIGYNWMASENRELHIRDNVRYVESVIAAVLRDYPSLHSLHLLGFSQGVAMAYRTAFAGERKYRSLVSVGGDLPPEFRSPTPLHERTDAIFLYRAEADSLYSEAQFQEDRKLLSNRGVTIRTEHYNGAHTWGEPLSLQIRAAYHQNRRVEQNGA